MVAGKLAGQDFNPDRVEYNVTKRSLWLTQGKPNEKPDLQLEIDCQSTRTIRAGRAPEDVTFKHAFRTSVKNSDGITLWPWARQAPGQGDPNPVTYGDAAYVIEFTGVKGDKLVGKIYICLGDEKKSFLAGSFEATLVK
jgi:hypothetical protein